MTSIVASPCVMLIGLPPKVLKYTRLPSVADTSLRAAIAAMRRAVAEALGHRDDVGRDAPILMRPVVMARAAEPALHFVGDAQAAVLADDVVDDLEILRGGRRVHDAADALNRLGDEAGDLARRLVLDDLLHFLRTLQVAGGILQPERAAVAVARRGVVHVVGRVGGEPPVPWAVRLIGVDVPPW